MPPDHLKYQSKLPLLEAAPLEYQAIGLQLLIKRQHLVSEKSAKVLIKRITSPLWRGMSVSVPQITGNWTDYSTACSR